MKISGICFLICGIALLLISGLYFYAYVVFEKFPHKTDRALGRLCSGKYKKDVAVWAGLGKNDGPLRVAFTIKHLTKTKYLYRVNNKLYPCVFDFWKKPSQIPYNSWVIYLKAFPGISYLDDDENYFGAIDFFVKAIVVLVTAICALGLGIAFLSKI